MGGSGSQCRFRGGPVDDQDAPRLCNVRVSTDVVFMIMAIEQKRRRGERSVN